MTILMQLTPLLAMAILAVGETATVVTPAPEAAAQIRPTTQCRSADLYRRLGVLRDGYDLYARPDFDLK